VKTEEIFFCFLLHGVLERLQPGYRAYSDRRAKLSSSRYRFRLARDIG
jgi:hypothetical protein